MHTRSSGLLPLRLQLPTLPLPCRPLAHGGHCRRCQLCLAFHQLLPQSAAADLSIRDQSDSQEVPDHHI